MVGISPWPLGSGAPIARLYLSIGIALLLSLWSIRLFISRSWSTRGNAPLYCLIGFVLLSIVQIISLPPIILKAISPGSADVYSYYLPAEHELLPGEADSATSPNHPISVTPSSTREFLIDCLALSVIYMVMINNVVSPGAFVRFAWVCAINGTLASLLAFAQRLSSTPNEIYWSITVVGTAYGPFGYRNAFPFFANVCIGLGLGLLGATARKSQSILQNARAIWLFAAIAVMITAVVFSFSRGGLLSLIVATGFGAILLLRQGRSRSPAALLIWLIPVVLFAGSWIGWAELEKRFQDLPGAAENRSSNWRDSLQHVSHFAICGTGNGSYAVVERITRTSPALYGLIPFADNEYVEGLVEGGVLRLGLITTLVLAVTFAGIRNYVRLRERTLGWIVLGALIGFWAIALHSFVDCGIHFPSNPILATVLAAHLVTARTEEEEFERIQVPLPFCLLIAPGMVLVGVLLVGKGFQNDRATRYHNAAILELRSEDSAAPARRVVFLEKAVHFWPDNFRFRNDLSVAYFDSSRLANEPTEAEQLLRNCLRQSRIARELSPASAEPHVRFAFYRDHFRRAQPAIWYLERARRSSPTDPWIWYACGKQRFDAGDFTGAWNDWRQTIALSLRPLDSIWPDAKSRLTGFEFLSKVLPDSSEAIYETANRIYPPNTIVFREARHPFLVRGLALLELRGANRTAREELRRGRILRELKRSDESIAALRSGIEKDPNLLECRVQLAEEFYDREMFDEANREVIFVLSRDPKNNFHAKELMEMIERELLIRP